MTAFTHLLNTAVVVTMPSSDLKTDKILDLHSLGLPGTTNIFLKNKYTFVSKRFCFSDRFSLAGKF